MEGTQKAKAEGIYKGRKLFIDSVRINAPAATGMDAIAIPKELNFGRASVDSLMREKTSEISSTK